MFFKYNMLDIYEKEDQNVINLKLVKPPITLHPLTMFYIPNLLKISILHKKTSSHIILFLLILFINLIPTKSAAQKNTKNNLWAEIWSNSSYRNTNFGVDKDLYKEEDFFITILSCNTGIRLPLKKSVFFDPYFNLDITEDFSNDSWNKVFWNNNMKYGPGLRFRYEYENKDKRNRLFTVNSFFMGIFSEYLFMVKSMDGADDSIPDNVNSENIKIGMDSWISIEGKESKRLSVFGEVWGELSYNSTNFYFKNMEDYYNLSVQPKIGIKYKHDKFALQPYYKLHLSEDFGDKSWNKEPWFNNIQYGPGIRLLFENFKIKEGLTLLIYAEWLDIDYLSKVDKSRCENISSRDYRINFELWIPFGAVTKSVFGY